VPDAITVSDGESRGRLFRLFGASIRHFHLLLGKNLRFRHGRRICGLNPGREFEKKLARRKNAT
jgi:hypothetical protein